MAIFSPFLVVNPSVIADTACPIISATLLPPAIVVAFDQVVSVFDRKQGHPQFCDLSLRGQAREGFPLVKAVRRIE